MRYRLKTPEQTPMLKLATDTETPVPHVLQWSVRGAYSQGAFEGQRIIVGYDQKGTLRRKVEVKEGDEEEELVEMWAWLDRHDPV